MNVDELLFALDIGTRSVIGVIGKVINNKLQVVSESYVEHEERAMVDGQIHDIALVTASVLKVKKELEERCSTKLTKVAIAAAGRFLRTTEVSIEKTLDEEEQITEEIIKAMELSAVKAAEEKVSMQSQGKLFCVGYSVKNYYINGYVISNLAGHRGEKCGVEVIATFLPRSVIDSLYTVMNNAQLEVISLTLEPIAALEAAIPQNLRLLNLVLVDIGAGTSDIAICSDEKISAYGMVSQAGDEVTEVLAHKLLVDFNKAEGIKKECVINGQASYEDILGLSHSIEREQLIKIIEPTVEKIAREIGEKVLSLNGGKAPAAIFMVGGGALTPGLKENLAKFTEVPAERVAIKDRKAVIYCEGADNSLGSAGITVLGIAMVALKNCGKDFIKVTLNQDTVTMFNSSKHRILNVLLQAGINPRHLLPKNGKNLHYTLNGEKKIAFGEIGRKAVIVMDNEVATLDTYVYDGARIEVKYSNQGKDAELRVLDLLFQWDTFTLYLDEKEYTLEPICKINGNTAQLTARIGEGDEVILRYPSTLGEALEQLPDVGKKGHIKRGNVFISEDEAIDNGDKLLCLETIENMNSIESEVAAEKTLCRDSLPLSLSVMVNGEKIVLKNKDKYIFIDIFECINFDLSKARGHLVLLLNHKKAGYHDMLSEGDQIEVYWE